LWLPECNVVAGAFNWTAHDDPFFLSRKARQRSTCTVRACRYSSTVIPVPQRNSCGYRCNNSRPCWLSHLVHLTMVSRFFAWVIRLKRSKSSRVKPAIIGRRTSSLEILLLLIVVPSWVYAVLAANKSFSAAIWRPIPATWLHSPSLMFSRSLARLRATSKNP
jgi:hypothetical protein